MKETDVKEYIRVQRSKRWSLFWEIKREMFRHEINAERIVYLTREWQRVDYEITEAKKLLRPNAFMQWVRSLK